MVGILDDLRIRILEERQARPAASSGTGRNSVKGIIVLLPSRSTFRTFVRRWGLVKRIPLLVRRSRFDRVLEREPVEVLVDVRVRVAGDAACAATTRLPAASSSPDPCPNAAATAVAPFLDLDPDGLNHGFVQIGAEHAPGVRGAQHRRAHAHVAPRLGHRAAAQRCVADVGRGPATSRSRQG